MVAVVRTAGIVFLRHKRNECEQTRYGGLHQWNFDVVGGNLLVWNNAVEVSVGSTLEGLALATAWISQGKVIARLVGSESGKLSARLPRAGEGRSGLTGGGRSAFGSVVVGRSLKAARGTRPALGTGSPSAATLQRTSDARMSLRRRRELASLRDPREWRLVTVLGLSDLLLKLCERRGSGPTLPHPAPRCVMSRSEERRQRAQLVLELAVPSISTRVNFVRVGAVLELSAVAAPRRSIRLVLESVLATLAALARE